MTPVKFKAFHITRITGEAVFGHESYHCDDSGCSGDEKFLSNVCAGSVEVDSAYEIAEDGSIQYCLK
jgi:hypothetical protein